MFLIWWNTGHPITPTILTHTHACVHLSACISMFHVALHTSACWTRQCPTHRHVPPVSRLTPCQMLPHTLNSIDPHLLLLSGHVHTPRVHTRRAASHLVGWIPPDYCTAPVSSVEPCLDAPLSDWGGGMITLSWTGPRRASGIDTCYFDALLSLPPSHCHRFFQDEIRST